MQVSGKACVGGIIGIITAIAVLSNVFHLNVVPTLAAIGFIALISVPVVFYCRTRRACSKQRVTNVCIHQLELARNLLMAEGRIPKHDLTTAAQQIEDGEISVLLLGKISFDGSIPTGYSSFQLHGMRSTAELSDDTIEVHRRW